MFTVHSIYSGESNNAAMATLEHLFYIFDAFISILKHFEAFLAGARVDDAL